MVHLPHRQCTCVPLSFQAKGHAQCHPSALCAVLWRCPQPLLGSLLSEHTAPPPRPVRPHHVLHHCTGIQPGGGPHPRVCSRCVLPQLPRPHARRLRLPCLPAGQHLLQISQVWPALWHRAQAGSSQVLQQLPVGRCHGHMRQYVQQDHAQGPDVRAAHTAAHTALAGLRGHVGGGAALQLVLTNCCHQDLHLVGRHREVTQVGGVGCVHHDVVRLEVKVHHLPVTEGGQPPQDIQHQPLHHTLTPEQQLLHVPQREWRLAASPALSSLVLLLLLAPHVEQRSVGRVLHERHDDPNPPRLDEVAGCGQHARPA
mmetsp:Transcript_28475/g.62670  ORF Transcript_28475/g.62670 Transcript_28475/m.62670 type:complete len:313 (-) Transcript_28475:1183-2121(-)